VAGIDVSIIIVNYNTFDLTCKCISAVITRTKGVSYEIILVDNASVECNADLFLQKSPTIRLIKSTTNLGFTGGNNLGVENAGGKYILLLNSDTELTEDSISKCYDLIRKDDKIGVISCKLLSPNGEIQSQCQRFPSISLKLIELFRIHKLIPQPKRGQLLGDSFYDHNLSGNVEAVWGTFFMFPVAILKHFEGDKLPGTFFMYGEDYEWCYAIKKAGYKIYYNASTSIIHHLGASSKLSVLKQKDQNGYIFVVKNYGWLYAKVWVFIRGVLFLTQSRYEYARDVAKLSFKLFIKGNVQ
jgi:GT2 family glycosyltransferase